MCGAGLTASPRTRYYHRKVVSMNKYAKHKGRNKNVTFIMLRHDIFESQAYRTMKPSARAVLSEIIRRYNGSNNGRISFSVREMAKRINVSHDTAGKAISEVLDRGFIIVTIDSAFNVKNRTARRFALTFETIVNEGNGHKTAPSNEWRKWKPAQGGEK